MKRILVLLLAMLMLLAACGGSEPGNIPETTITDAPDTSVDPVETDPVITEPTETEPAETIPAETEPAETEPVETEPAETEPVETEPVVPVERFDYAIDVKDDTYVLNKDNNGDKSDANFSTETLIDLKSNKGSLTRYGFLKFDLSSLKGDNDFTCIELDLTVSWKQADAGNPELAAIEVYGCDPTCDISAVTFNTQPMVLDFICKIDNISNTKEVTYNFPVTDYIRKAVQNGQSEVVFYLKEATPVTPLRLKIYSKENGTSIPKLSVYYGTKIDNTTYEGDTELGDPDISKNGLDAILGQSQSGIVQLAAVEDTYVEAGNSANTNFGESDILDFKAWPGTASNYYRIPFIKFDISTLDKPVNSARLILECTSMEDPSVPTTVQVYGCNPYEWNEGSLTYNTIPEREELITSTAVVSKGKVYIDITDYVNEFIGYGEREISLWLEGAQDSIRRLKFATNENNSQNGPILEVSTGGLYFSTYIQYVGENPWEVAMKNVGEWLTRWEEIKKVGDPDAEKIVKNNAEYTLSVDAARSGSTNGANTKYTAYPTRNVSTLNGYTQSFSETKKYDEYGGLMDESMKQEATGFFYTTKIGDRWWTIDPLGYPFFRTAVVTVTMGNKTQKAKVLAKYGDNAGWAQATNDRLFELGFNSVGGWSSIADLIKSENPTAQTQIIGLVGSYASSLGLNVSESGSTDLVGNVLPVFDPDFVEYVDSKVKSTVSKYADSPYVYGWMSDNELPDEINMLDNALAFDPTDMRFIYSYATAWTFMYMKTGKADVSTEDVTDELRREFRAMTYDKLFYETCTALEKYDPNHQFMGSRFLAGCYKDEYVLKVAGYWCDVITLNYYGAWDADPTIIYNIQRWAGKPFVITEWYAKGMDVWEKDNRMTNKSGAGWTVRNQTERGKYYQNFALSLLECKGCVGFDWFKYWDNDPDDLTTDLSNRNANKGIIDNDGNEYTELTEYMEELNNQKYNLIKFFDAR